MPRKKLEVEIRVELLLAEIARVLRLIPYPCNAATHLKKSGNALSFNLGEAVKVKAAKYDICRQEAGEILRASGALVVQRHVPQREMKSSMTLEIT